MVPTKSIPQNRVHSTADPFDAVLRPPRDETPSQREARILAEQHAKRVSDAIDEQLQVERAELKKNQPDVKILLLGQSESGKSTTLKQFQLLHTPAAFQAERTAWRIVIYLNLVRSVRRILDTIFTEREEEGYGPTDSASLLSDGQTVSSTPTDPEIHRIAAEKHVEYMTALRPLLELEGKLIRKLREDDDDDEATRLGDGSAPGWSVPRGEYAVRTTSNWKRALTLRRSRSNRTSTSTSTPWWEDPSDPVHVLDRCRDAMTRLWKDEWVRRYLVEKRIRLQESSGLRITAKSYTPTDEDVLKARLKTVGVVEHRFAISMGTMRGSTNWVIYDVGGARNQRQAMDSHVNRLEDSLLLWRALVSNKLLEKVPIVIFLNKCDLLREKLEAGVQLKNYMVTYGDRPNDYESVSKYLRNKFGSLHNQNSPNRERELFIHYTAVIDKAKTAQIIMNVRESILRLNLKTLKLM
ncbi:guanine nucleotide binding protein, alpha subunit [Lactifluus volemus]|nr:guanine nucleotide binding protein, alpha subunit [Lactifluus volemus]